MTTLRVRVCDSCGFREEQELTQFTPAPTISSVATITFEKLLTPPMDLCPACRVKLQATLTSFRSEVQT